MTKKRGRICIENNKIYKNEESKRYKKKETMEMIQTSNNVITNGIWKSDVEGYLMVKIGSLIHHKFKVIDIIGQGKFSKVYSCFDTESQGIVAVKVIKNIKKYVAAANLEFMILEKISKYNPGDIPVIKLLDNFSFYGHPCFVFENLGYSLYEFMERNNSIPFSLNDIKIIGKQLLLAIKYIHDLQIIHTDLKPENVLFQRINIQKYPINENTCSLYKFHQKKGLTRLNMSKEIRLIDFGNATLFSPIKNSLISTRHYRAPEVIVENIWSYPVDMWSFGCILYELYTGHVAFQPKSDIEHLAMMERFLGKFSPDFVDTISPAKKAEFFNDEGNINYDLSNETLEKLNRMIPLVELVKSTNHYEIYECFVKLLEFDPHKRISPSDCLELDFFKK